MYGGLTLIVRSPLKNILAYITLSRHYIEHIQKICFSLLAPNFSKIYHSDNESKFTIQLALCAWIITAYLRYSELCILHFDMVDLLT